MFVMLRVHRASNLFNCMDAKLFVAPFGGPTHVELARFPKKT